MSHYFWPILTPSSCHTLSHIPGTPKSTSHISFLVRLVQKTWTKTSSTNSLSVVRGGFCAGGLSLVFCLEGFVRGGFCPFPFLSEYICYNRKLNITFNFRFHMYDKNFYKCDATCS